MGTWEELDIKVSVTVDTSDLDAIKQLDKNIFGEAFPLVDQIKEAFETGSQKGASEIANRTKSWQQEEIANKKKHPYSRGKLSGSIEAEGDKYTYLIGTTISHFYPLSVEKGRIEVRPKKKKALHWFMPSGEEVFAMKSKATDGTPFVKPTYQKADKKAKKLMEIEVGSALKKVLK